VPPFFSVKGAALRYVAWGVRLLLFGLLFGFALKNTDPVNLRFYFDYVWSAPLVLVLLFFFAGGIVIGFMAGMLKVYRQRREILLLKRELRARGRGDA
jgi:lipopolysaccharide assembly protein A